MIYKVLEFNFSIAVVTLSPRQKQVEMLQKSGRPWLTGLPSR